MQTKQGNLATKQNRDDIDMELHDIGVYNTPETGVNEAFETIQEEVEWEDEEYEEDARIIVPPE